MSACRTHCYSYSYYNSLARLCITHFLQLARLPSACTMPFSFLEIGLQASKLKLCNLHDYSPKYVVSQFSCSFWFSTYIFLAMTVSMSLGIASVHLPLSSTCTMASKGAKMKTPFKPSLGMQSIKCL